LATIDAPTVTVGARVPRELRDDLDRLVQATGRNRNTLVEEAIRRFVAVEQWQLADIEAGIQDADADDFATAEEVEATFR
jgi:predicted transcriptional regulator